MRYLSVCSGIEAASVAWHPPYHPSTRSTGNRRRGAGYHVYRHELEADCHVALLEQLCGLKGMVVLSGYPTELYDAALLPLGWQREQRAAYADGGGERTEVLWINPAAHLKMNQARDAARQPALFDQE